MCLHDGLILKISFSDNEPSALDIPDKDNVTPLAAVFSGANGNMTRTRVDLVK